MHRSGSEPRRFAGFLVKRAARIALAVGLGAIAVAARPAVAAMTPPPAFVMASDGSTQLTLEEAGILNPDGRKWAVILGKALFWDQQAGSDGQACASCHFHAGTDTRLTNQLNPGLKANDTAFGAIAPLSKVGRMASGASARSNYTVVPKDFPFYQLANPLDRNSA